MLTRNPWRLLFPACLSPVIGYQEDSSLQPVTNWQSEGWGMKICSVYHLCSKKSNRKRNHFHDLQCSREACLAHWKPLMYPGEHMHFPNWWNNAPWTSLGKWHWGGAEPLAPDVPFSQSKSGTTCWNGGKSSIHGYYPGWGLFQRYAACLLLYQEILYNYYGEYSLIYPSSRNLSNLFFKAI